MSKRYSIQVSYDLQRTWSHFYAAKTCWTLRGARKEWWHWANHDWHYAQDLPIFRIYDEREGKAVE